MKIGLLLTGLLTLFGCSSMEKDENRLVDTDESKYKVGQVWKYKSRPNEPNSTLTILKVKAEPEAGTIVHISVDGLQLKGNADLSDTHSIGHMPIAEAALDSSVTELVKSNQPVSDDFMEGYGYWRAAFVSGEGGIFSSYVSEGIAYTEETMATGARIEE